MERIVAHLDMNSFFASVEQQANPTLRGRPLGVCAYLHQYGCVIAASIEAKRLGMKVGMTMDEARWACPGAVFVQNDPPKYRAVSSRVFSILQELTERLEIYSIDEAFLDLTGWYRDSAEAAWALTNVRRRITEEVGDWLRCSIGIAPTRFLAKTASDLQKPNGLVIIDLENLDATLAKLDLEDVCGIGPRMRRRLERAGFYTLLEVKRQPVQNLMSLFGKYGYFLWCKLNAVEVERVSRSDETAPKSIGHSYCVPAQVNREGKVVAVLTKLTERAGRRMRREGVYAGSISVAVGLRRGGSKPTGPFWQPTKDAGGTLSQCFDEPARDSFALVAAACELLGEMWSGEQVNFLAVTLYDFSVPNGQTSFTSPDTRRMQHERRVSDAVDLIRDRYGDNAIQFASMMATEDSAPDRIGFRKTDGVELTPSG